MKYDKIPIVPKTEQEAPKEEQKESPKTSTENTTAYLNLENQNIFSKMSEGGKKIANQVYENLYRIPIANKVIGKLEIAYNQFWLDKHEKKAIKLKMNTENLNLQDEALNQSKESVESAIENLKRLGMSGVESLQIELRNIAKQKTDLLDKKNRAQSKLESRDNKMKLYTNKRDAIADKLIGHYNEKLGPMEKELESLQTCKDQVDLSIAVTEAKHSEQLEKLDDIERKKVEIEVALRATGMSERKIKNSGAIKALERILAQGHKKINMEKGTLARKKAEATKRIAKTDEKANPYRDKREEFAHIKEGRPVKIETEARQRGKEFKGEEKILPHTREKKTETEETTPEETSIESAPGIRKEQAEKLEISSYISNWNIHLQKKYGKSISSEIINQKDFLEAISLPESYQLNFKNFKNILEKYYKFKKAPMGKFNKHINEFFEEKIKTQEQ